MIDVGIPGSVEGGAVELALRNELWAYFSCWLAGFREVGS